MLQEQLEESHQLNKLLHQHLQHIPAADKQVEWSEVGPVKDVMGIDQIRGGGSKDKTDSVNQNRTRTRLRGDSESMFEVSNGSLLLWNSYLPSFMDLPDLSFDEESLSQMRVEDLLQLVRNLKKQLAEVLRIRNDGNSGLVNAMPVQTLEGSQSNGHHGQTMEGSQANGSLRQTMKGSQSNGCQGWMSQESQAVADNIIAELEKQLEQVGELEQLF